MVTKSVPTKKTPGINDLTREFFKTCKKDTNTNLIQTFSEYRGRKI